MIVSMLTTHDNPFDPFDDWDAWFQWDVAAGYHTPSLLARISVTSDELSDADRNLSITYAIDEIVENNELGFYKKVSREVEDVIEA